MRLLERDSSAQSHGGNHVDTLPLADLAPSTVDGKGIDFWFLPPSEMQTILSHSSTSSVELQSKTGNLQLQIAVETSPAQIPGRLNEDCPLVVPVGKGRQLVAINDGASSRLDIPGLAKLGIKGAFYSPHLIWHEFPSSETFDDLSKRDDLTAAGVVKGVNSWLKRELSKVDGINPQDVLTLPGISPVYALIDANTKKITTAQAADAGGAVEYPGGKKKLMTHNQNEVYDAQTLELVQRLARENGITPRQVLEDPIFDHLHQIVKKQLKDSFKGKINVGCGILNGQNELVNHGLIYTQEAEIVPGTVLTLWGDGAILPWCNKDLTHEQILSKFLEATKNYPPGNNFNFTRHGLDILAKDPEYVQIPRLRNDDFTIIQVAIN